MWIRFLRWLGFRGEPFVLVSRYGQRTARPRVAVSAVGGSCSQGVYDYDDDEVGNARATLHAQGLARALERPLVDERKGPPSSEPERGR